TGHDANALCPAQREQDGKSRAGKWGAEGISPLDDLDARQLPRSPVTRELAEGQPDELVEVCVQPRHDLLEDRKADLLAVEVEPGPVPHQDRRLPPAADPGEASPPPPP